jgi:hypothetical protein
MRPVVTREQRNDFQRQTLVDLQEATMSLMLSTSDLHEFDNLSYIQHGKRMVEPYPKKFTDANERDYPQTAVLGVRVRDDVVRALLSKLKSTLAAVQKAENQSDGIHAMAEASKQFVVLNDRIGEVLRMLDDF